MLDEPGILTASRVTPGACSELWWGRRLGALHVNLDQAEPAWLGELLSEAWERKAPRRLLSAPPNPNPHPTDRAPR